MTDMAPAEGDFTGCAEVDAQPGDAVWVVAGEEVVRVREPLDARD